MTLTRFHSPPPEVVSALPARALVALLLLPPPLLLLLLTELAYLTRWLGLRLGERPFMMTTGKMGS